MTDSDLIQKIHNGDQEATGILIERYYADIYHFCLYMVQSEEDAYDITQETFLKFVKYGTSYQNRNLKGYLLTIARNICFNYFQDKKKSVTTVEWEAIDQRFDHTNAMHEAEDAIYLEKKYMQMHIWHRACAKLNRTDCDRILRGDIEWMKDSKEALFQDFYLQATLNHLSPGNVIEYQKERLKCKEGYVAFVKKVRCVVGGWGNLFWPEAMTIQCLEENKVLTVYKKRVNLPNTIWEMMQGTAILSEDMAFAF